MEGIIFSSLCGAQHASCSFMSGAATMQHLKLSHQHLKLSHKPRMKFECTDVWEDTCRFLFVGVLVKEPMACRQMIATGCVPRAFSV